MASLGLALSTFIFSNLLAAFGFSADQPLGIRLIGPAAGLAVAIGLLVFAKGYRLPDSVSLRAERNTGEARVL